MYVYMYMYREDICMYICIERDVFLHKKYSHEHIIETS